MYYLRHRRRHHSQTFSLYILCDTHISPAKIGDEKWYASIRWYIVYSYILRKYIWITKSLTTTVTNHQYQAMFNMCFQHFKLFHFHTHACNEHDSFNNVHCAVVKYMIANERSEDDNAKHYYTYIDISYSTCQLMSSHFEFVRCIF